ncbi:23S rRNA (uracil(747)-C(5))-methyltransferase RlmC [Ruicaihuangia caeni]|uniref:23S rRNA (uracil(747)-C(5))-methyltransferase RlmC n=1 Tax=Ruicaihuangia caeni TaxID=3042517 RepID=UPI00338FF3AD
MQCAYFDAAVCGSCTLMGQSYDEQLAGKDRHARHLLAAHRTIEWMPPVASRETGFRNKAKMVVGGSQQHPTLGILDAGGAGVDLRDCGILQPGLRAAFPALAEFIGLAKLEPYSVPRRRGELKNLILTESPAGELLLRFVLRTTEALPRIRKHLPALLERMPQLRVASANLLPEHKAVVEGAEEIPLTEQQTLTMEVNGIRMMLRPQSFFQTNTEIAAALYRQAREWVDEVGPSSVWDLYCGVGGFALHSALMDANSGAPGREVVGVEASAEAIESARLAARSMPGLRFVTSDATAFAVEHSGAPDLVIVNPPRRGIGSTLAEWLEGSGVRHVVYSSCNAQSLAKDLERMPSLLPVRARVLDMFPHTGHYEVITLLERR